MQQLCFSAEEKEGKEVESVVRKELHPMLYVLYRESSELEILANEVVSQQKFNLKLQ